MGSFAKPQPAKRRAKVLLLGKAGTGKTHAALTFPRPAVIDVEGSADWFADRFEFESVATKRYDDVMKLIAEVRQRPGDHDTLVIDSLTVIWKALIKEVGNGRDDLRPLEWGRIKRKYSDLLDELYYRLPMNVVCTGWLTNEYAKAGEIVDGQRVNNKDLTRLGDTFDGDPKALYAFDFVFEMKSAGGKFFAIVLKSRSGKLKHGDRIENFSWKTIENLVGTADAPAALAKDPPPDAPPAAPVDEAVLEARKAVKAALGLPDVVNRQQGLEMAELLGRALGVKKGLGEFTTSELLAYVAIAPVHHEIDAYLRSWELDDDDEEVQAACGRVTADSERGVRYAWRELGEAESRALLADLKAHEPKDDTADEVA